MSERSIGPGGSGTPRGSTPNSTANRGNSTGTSSSDSGANTPGAGANSTLPTGRTRDATPIRGRATADGSSVAGREQQRGGEGRGTGPIHPIPPGANRERNDSRAGPNGATQASRIPKLEARDPDESGYPKEAPKRGKVPIQEQPKAPKASAQAQAKFEQRQREKHTYTREENIAKVIQTAHKSAERFISPSLAISEEEAYAIADPLVEVADLYEVDIDQLRKAIALANLVGAIINVEGPKIMDTMRYRHVRRASPQQSRERSTVELPNDGPIESTRPWQSPTDTGFVPDALFGEVIG